MKFETLKNKKHFLYVLIVGIIVFITLILSTSLAKYKVTQSIKIVSGNISYSFADLNIIAMYQEDTSGTYDEITVVPDSGYVINEESSYCNINGEKDNNAVLKTIDGIHSFANLQKGSKCYLYFDILVASGSNAILANKTVSTRTSFTSAVTASSTGKVYQAEDDLGLTYYFAGAPTDNWVKFAGYYWRIIRINGNGSIRMIYQGTAANVTGTETQTETSYFYSVGSGNQNINHVGYMYTTNNTSNSAIKDVVDTWYTNNLTNYTSYLDVDAGFCNDRTVYSVTDYSTYTTNNTFLPYIRIYSSKTPTFKCVNSNDLFTHTSSVYGNKKLTYPIGLITADEVVFAGGGASVTNTSFYLYTGQQYWTMSPATYNGSGSYDHPYMYCYSNVLSNSCRPAYFGDTFGIRPVINLRADVTFKAGTTGTSSNPYEVI